VLDRIRLIEAGLQPQSGSTNTAAASSVSYSADHMVEIENQVRLIMAAKGHASVSELWYWTVRGLAVISSIALVIFLFFHDY